MAHKKLKIGLLTRDSPLSVWQDQILERLQDDGLAQVSVWASVKGRGKPSHNTGLFTRAYRQLSLKRKCKMLRPAAPHPQRDDASVHHVDDTQDILAALRQAEPDLILNFSGLHFDDLENVASHGCCFFTDDTICPVQTAMPFARSLLNRDRAIRLSLMGRQRYGRHTRILETATTPGYPDSHAQCIDHALETAADLMVRVCVRLSTASEDVLKRHGTTPPVDAQGNGGTVGGLGLLSAIVGQKLRPLAKPFKFLKRLMRYEVWNIAIIDQPWHEWVNQQSPSAVKWFPDPGPQHTVADPFAWRSGEHIHLLVEDMDYRLNKGVIAQRTLNSRTFESSPLHLALERPVHLSFPSLLFIGGKPFFTPESHQDGKISLFEGVPVPANSPLDPQHKWLESGLVMDAIPAVDPVVFERGDKWWLICSDQSDGPNSKLNAWYANTIRGPWTAHPMNPIVIDVCSARSAGPWLHADGRLYRPGQDCSHTYGGATAIHEVLRLSTDDYAETPAWRIEPDPDGPYPNGLHTICPVGDLTFIDGKRYSFSLSNMRLKIRNRHTNPKNGKVPQSN